MIAIGRPFLANPDLIERWQNGWPENPMPEYRVLHPLSPPSPPSPSPLPSIPFYHLTITSLRRDPVLVPTGAGNRRRRIHGLPHVRTTAGEDLTTFVERRGKMWRRSLGSLLSYKYKSGCIVKTGSLGVRWDNHITPTRLVYHHSHMLEAFFQRIYDRSYRPIGPLLHKTQTQKSHKVERPRISPRNRIPRTAGVETYSGNEGGY